MTADDEAAVEKALLFFCGPDFRDALDRGSVLRRGWLKHDTVTGWAPPRGSRAVKCSKAKMRGLIKMARDGDADADVILRDIASDMLKEGVPLPKPLATYSAEALRIPPGKVRLRPGPGPNALMIRNRIIFDAVMAVKGLGYRADRNRAPARGVHKKESACSIVAKALKRVGLRRMKDTSVAEIYWQSKKTLKPRTKN